MVNIKKYILVVIIFLFGSVYATADNLQMEATVNQTTVALNETIQLTVSLTADSKSLPDYAVPQLNDFNIFSTSQSKSISIVNGKVKNTVYYVYTLGPRKMGVFTIPAFTLQYQGQTYQTNPIDITVEKAQTVSSIDNAGTQGNTAGQNQQNSSKQIYNHDTSKAVFVEAKTDKQTAYVNEKVVYTFSFFTSVNILSNPNYRGPDFAGFFNGKTTQRNYRTQIKGRDYVVSEVSTELFPQKEGAITIGKATVQVSIEDFNKMQDDFFASFFKSARNVDLATEEIKIKVLKVPENIDLVGKFNISANVDKKQKRVDEPFDLKITINGSGNVKTIKEPQIVLSDNLKKYETSEKVLKNGEEETGKEFSTLIMPLEKGIGEIKILPIKYFDMATKQIKSLPEKRIKINIAEGTVKKDISQNEIIANTQTVQNMQTPQIPQNVDLSFIFKIYAFLQKTTFWIVVTVLLGFYIVIKLFFKYKEYVNKDQQKLKNKKAYNRSKKYFQKAKRAKISNEFYSLMYKGMLEYFASVLGESADGLTTYTIKLDLQERNINTDLIKEIENILEECSIYLYSQSQNMDTTDFKNFYNKAFDILKKLDI
ncbi:MAG: BatD family protein [Endomicrobiaceae bacterium]|nr:BatD family protein [Endomicrobiaceae bacterium]